MATGYNWRVKSLAKQCEQYRKEKGIEKLEMSRLCGAPSYQHYYMWMKRDSIPKAYVDRVKAVISQDKAISKRDAEILEKFARLSDQEADTVLQMVEGLLSRSAGD